MGIKHLRLLLKTICKKNAFRHFTTVDEFILSEKSRLYNDIIKTKNINNPIQQMRIKNEIAGKPYFIGIDAHLFASRYKRVFGRIEYGFFRQIMLSLSSKMIPIYVFDGVPPEQKKKTINQRHNKKQRVRNKLGKLLELKTNEININELIQNLRNKSNKTSDFLDNESESKSKSKPPENTNPDTILDAEVMRLAKKSISIDHNDIQNLKNFLSMLGIPYVTAVGEADDLIASLYKKGIINACQSDDTDMLPKGCGNLIQINKNGLTQFLLDEILSELGMTHHEFIDLCILLGSDYYSTYLPKLNAIDLFNLFIQNPTLEKFVDNYSNVDPKIISHLNAYIGARSSFFLTDEKIDMKHIRCELKYFNFEDILLYFKNIGIFLSRADNIKFQSMIKNVNEFISVVKKINIT